MDAAVALGTPPFPFSLILRKAGVILFRYERALSVRGRKRVALQFLVAQTKCLPPRIPTCYARCVNRNIFYIIGVIVVIVIVLKMLGLF